jgi:hypothetical protein
MSKGIQDIFLAHFFGLRWQAQRGTALLVAFALADHLSGDTSKLSGTLNRSGF